MSSIRSTKSGLSAQSSTGKSSGSHQMTRQQLANVRKCIGKGSRSASSSSSVAVHSVQELVKPETSVGGSGEVAAKAHASAVDKRKHRHTHSIRKNITSTLLTFHQLKENENKAVLQMLLCNISERTLTFNLKCNVGHYLKAIPSASAHIPAKSQMRIYLTWTKPDEYASWSEVPQAKMILMTTFLEDDSSKSPSLEKMESDCVTKIRLMARVSSSMRCLGSEAPIEQLLLDAVGRDDDGSHHPQQLHHSAMPLSITTPKSTSSETVNESTKSSSKEKSALSTARSNPQTPIVLSPLEQATMLSASRVQPAAEQTVLNDRIILIVLLVFLFAYILLQNRQSAEVPLTAEMMRRDRDDKHYY